MSYGDFEYDMEVQASARRELPRLPQPLVRRRPLQALLAEARGVRERQAQLLVSGRLREAAELSPDLDRLTREYVRRRDAPPVRLPF